MGKGRFMPGLYIAAGIIILMTVAAALQIQFLQKPDSPGAFRFFAQRLSLIHIILALGGMLLLLWRSAGLQRRLGELEELVRPLTEGDPGGPEKGSGRGAYAGLKQTLDALDAFHERLEGFVRESGETRELLSVEQREREGIAAHINGVLGDISGQFFEIEASAQQALNALAGLGDYFDSRLNAAGEQARFMDEAGVKVSGAAALSDAMGSALRESGEQARELRGLIAAGDEQFRAAQELLRNTAGEIDRITEIAGVIDKISEQTNILSMNAAIESAHAGAVGAGFAVVADEIKKLAESSAENAHNIQEALKAVDERMKEALGAGEVCSEHFGSIGGKIGELGEKLRVLGEDALKNTAAGEEIRALMAESTEITRKVLEGGADIMANHQSFRSALEQIHRLSEKTRTGVKELESGTGEILENLKKSRGKIQEMFKRTGELGEQFPGAGAPGPDASGSEASGSDAPGSGKPGEGKTETDNSWRKDVTVKTPPATVP